MKNARFLVNAASEHPMVVKMKNHKTSTLKTCCSYCFRKKI